MNHILYKTINIINNKIYIGVHSTDNIDDGYMGSGTLLKFAIEKYDINNFKRIILRIYPSREKLMRVEKWIVNEKFVARQDTYNLKIGGEGGSGMGGRNHSEETKRIMSEAHKGISSPLKDIPRSEETKIKISKSMSGRIFSEKHKQKLSETHKGNKHSEETKRKMSEALKGEKNPNYGKHPSKETKLKRKRIVKCPHCGRKGGITGMGRWHFNNCRYKKNPHDEG